jgi:hypothetical protein
MSVRIGAAPDVIVFFDSIVVAGLIYLADWLGRPAVNS